MTLFFSQPTLAQTIYIEVDDLLVRSGPGTSYDLIGHVNEGETYPFIDEDGDWFAISYENQTGWVSSEYASKTDQTDFEQNKLEQDATDEDISQVDLSDPEFKIPVETLHLRADATTESDILSVLTKGEQVTIIAEENQWLLVETHDNEGYIPAWLLNFDEDIKDKGPASLLDKVIVIDPGHGGYDVGAISITDEYEKDYALFTAKLLKTQLEREGANVYLTRDADTHFALSARATLANYLVADVFLSIHYNSEPQYPYANGINTFYRNPRDRQLADDVHEGLLDATGANDREVRVDDFQVLRVSKQPSLLLELGFLSNEEEEQKIKSYDYQNKISQGIIQGLQSYFTNQ